jgi:hypothetical protein
MRFLLLLIFGVLVEGSDRHLRFRYIFLDVCYRQLHMAAAKRYFEQLKRCWQKCKTASKGFFVPPDFRYTNYPGIS